MRYFSKAENAFEFYYNLMRNGGIDYKDTKAIFNESFQIGKPELHYIGTTFRKWSLSYAHTEWLWYMSGDRSVEEIKKQAKIWDSMHGGDNLVWSNYGYWWKLNDQLRRIIEMLKIDSETRRAILVHYDPNQVQDYLYDTPCNVFLHFYIIGNQLHLTIHARSIDVWYGFCNDQYMFSKLLMQVCDEIGKDIGSMYFQITNFHLYKNKIK